MKRLWPLVLGTVPGLVLLSAWGGEGAALEVMALPAGLIATTLAMAAGCWVLSTARLRMLLRQLGARLGAREALRMQLALEFGLCALPAGAGGPVVWAMLGRRAGLRAVDGVAACACDRAVDLAFFAIAVPAVALWAGHRAVLPLPGGWVAGQAGVALLVLVALALAMWRLHATRGRLPRRLAAAVPRGARARLRAPARYLRETLGALRAVRPALCGWLLGLAAAHWVLRYSILAVLLHGLGAPQPWELLFVAQTATLALAQAVPLPGGAGAVEAGMGAVLAPRVDGATLAAALLAWRVVTYHVYLLAGAAGWLAVFGPARARVDLPPVAAEPGGKP